MITDESYDFHQVLLGYGFGVATNLLEDDLHISTAHSISHIDVGENPLHAVQGHSVALVGHGTEEVLLESRRHALRVADGRQDVVRASVFWKP